MKVISDNRNDVNDEENNDEPILTDEEIENLDLNSERAQKLIKQFEKETGKYAIWRGNVTEVFKKWLRKEKIYLREKERISLYISEETKNRWQDFINQNKEEFPTLSELIRQCVKFYINNSKERKSDLSTLYQKSISNISHALKEPLTSIKGYSQFLFENKNYKEKLSEDVKDKVKNILEQSTLLENRIINFLDNINIQNHEYDILLIEDDLPTILLITRYFNGKGYTCKGFASGVKGLEELDRAQPKVILLDIILPDLSGYDICERIKSSKKLKKIPIFFLTAISGSEVEKHLKKTKADGFILKPFNLSDFEGIFEILKNDGINSNKNKK